jgi:hypothetical protein
MLSMNLSRKTILSIVLVLLGIGSGLLVVFTYAMSGGSATITLAFLAASITCIIAGSILAFSKVLDRFVNPLVDEFHGDIEDDLKDLKEHRITNTIWMIIITGILLLVFSFLVLRFHKVEARWGSIPVVIPTFIGMAALAWFIPRTRWFQLRAYTPMWIFLIPTIGFIITIVLGVAKTENTGIIFASRQESIDYNTAQYAGYMLINAAGQNAGELDLAIPDCDGEGCTVVLVIGLIILVFVLVIGSALIPHFWLLSGSILLTIMALIALHDLLIRQST